MTTTKRILNEIDIFVDLMEERKTKRTEESIKEYMHSHDSNPIPEGISLNELHVLKCIADNPQIVSIDIASQLNLTRGGISKLITRLSDKKIIETYKERPEQKKIFFRLTELGTEINALHEKYHNKVFQEYEMALEGFNEEEKETILRFFKKINGQKE